jgi:hypothetical protein
VKTPESLALQKQGPVYGVELIDTLPLGNGGMSQQMPTRDDLKNVRRVDGGERVAAGYEVLLAHYRNTLERLKAIQ